MDGKEGNPPPYSGQPQPGYGATVPGGYGPGYGHDNASINAMNPPQAGYPAPQAGYPAPQAGYPAPQAGYPASQPFYGAAPQPYYGAVPQQTQSTSSNNIVVLGGGAPVTNTVIVERRGINHCLHCVITLFFFPWIIVWIILCITDG